MPRRRRLLPALVVVPLVCLAFVACAEEKGTGGTWLDPENGGPAGGASGQSCEFGGKTYEPGETMPADCNTCTCQAGGAWRCTLIACPGDGGAAGASGGEAGTGGAATGEGGSR